jgi:transposase-like protein
VKKESNLFTDKWLSYRGLDNDYIHQVINHSVEYVKDNVHTKGIENFWALLKRTLKGTYVSVEPFHLPRYLAEQTFRFNERKGNDKERFLGVLRAVSGKRLTYNELRGYQNNC